MQLSKGELGLPRLAWRVPHRVSPAVLRGSLGADTNNADNEAWAGPRSTVALSPGLVTVYTPPLFAFLACLRAGKPATICG